MIMSSFKFSLGGIARRQGAEVLVIILRVMVCEVP